MQGAWKGCPKESASSPHSRANPSLGKEKASFWPQTRVHFSWNCLAERERPLPRLGALSCRGRVSGTARCWGHSTEWHALLALAPGLGGRFHLTLCWGLHTFSTGSSTHSATESRDEPPPLLSPHSCPARPAPSPPAPNHCSFLPQVYRPRKQPLSSNIPCTCDACYSPDITAKYHGSSYDAYMVQRSQVSQLLRRHVPPPPGGWGCISTASNLDLHLL